jgi:hypothetical protein
MSGVARGASPRASQAARGIALRRGGEALGGLDANDGGDARRLETTPGVVKELLHGAGIEPAGDLVGAGDREMLARHREEPAVLELVLEGLHLGFVSLERQVGVADRVGESFVGKIV